MQVKKVKQFANSMAHPSVSKLANQVHLPVEKKNTKKKLLTEKTQSKKLIPKAFKFIIFNFKIP